jgi:hypothetical protein
MGWNTSIPAMGNQISADIPDIEENLEFVIQGDGTEGRVLRLAKCVMAYSATANSIDVYLESLWNGDNVDSSGSPHEITRGDGDTNWSYAADGKKLTIETAGLSGNVVLAIGVWTYANIDSSAFRLCRVGFESNDITIEFFGSDGVGTPIDDLFASGDSMECRILYMTDA